jgi:hypothetical protein
VARGAWSQRTTPVLEDGVIVRPSFSSRQPTERPILGNAVHSKSGNRIVLFPEFCSTVSAARDIGTMVALARAIPGNTQA